MRFLAALSVGKSGYRDRIFAQWMVDRVLPVSARCFGGHLGLAGAARGDFGSG